MKKHEQVRRILQEIKALTRDLPAGKRNMISNRCDKISLIVKKMKYGKRTNNQVYS